MTRKSLSLITAIGILYVYLQSQLHSDDALFLVASASFWVNFLLLSFAVIAVIISFKEKFRTWEAYLANCIMAGFLSLSGSAGLIYSSANNYFSGFLKPMDYFIILELGIIYSVISLSYNHPPVKIKKLSSSYAFAGQRIRRQLSGVAARTVIMPGRHTPGQPAA